MDDRQLFYTEWTLRIAFFLTFIGHGVLAVMKKQGFIDLVVNALDMEASLATTLIFWIGVIDIIAAVVVLFAPIRILLVGGALWGFATALARPMAADAFWGPAFLDFVERGANYGVPMALLFLRGLPKNLKEWFM